MKTENLGANQLVDADANTSLIASRRQVLLKGIGKGSAVLVAAVPLQTLAGQRLITSTDGKQCSVSGMHSGVHSKNTDAVVCGGYSPGWWGQSKLIGTTVAPKNWPATLPLTDNGYNTKFRYVFGDAANLRNTDGTVPSLWQIMEPKEPISKFSSTDEFHWVCAWLNAIVRYPATFPYTATEVVAKYKLGKSSPIYQDYLTFFKTYMEKV